MSGVCPILMSPKALPLFPIWDLTSSVFLGDWNPTPVQAILLALCHPIVLDEVHIVTRFDLEFQGHPHFND